MSRWGCGPPDFGWSLQEREGLRRAASVAATRILGGHCNLGDESRHKMKVRPP